MFFYLRDAQGVIYDIINSVGNIVARYTYDVYGKVLTSTGEAIGASAMDAAYYGVTGC